METQTPFDWHPIWLSLFVAGAALAIVFPSGILLARVFTRCRFFGQDFVEGLILLPLVLPPVVTGFVLLLLLGNNGPVGNFLSTQFGVQVVFTPYAAIIASAIVALPLMYQSARAAMQNIDSHLEDAARSLGADSWRTFWTVALPLCRSGLVAGALLSFARALGEFGATIMVAGNIPGVTTTAPLAIYFASESGDLNLATIYAIIIGVLNMALVVGLNIWLRRVTTNQKPS